MERELGDKRTEANEWDPDVHAVWEWASEGGSPSGPMLFPYFEGDTGWIISKTESAL